MGVIDFLTIILLAVAIITLVFMGWETSLTRKQMRGEVYSRARVKDLYFLLPATCQREVEGFKQEDEEERSLGQYLAIPVGLERELHICLGNGRNSKFERVQD